MADEPRRRMRLVELLAVTAIIGVIVVLLLPAIQASRSAARRTQRHNNLKNVGLSVLNFQDVYRHYPAAVRRDDVGRPLGSWRYRVLPFVAAFMTDVDYSRPWCDPEAKYFSTRPMEIYCFSEASGDMPCNTNVVAIQGPGTPFDETRVNTASDFDDQTILAIEIAEFDRHWMEPGDLNIDDLSDSLMGGIDGQGVLVVCIDNSVRYVSRTTSVNQAKKYVRADDAEDRDPNVFVK